MNQMKNNNLKYCYDPKGPACFGITKDGQCICLNDTRTVPCPFFKTRIQVENERKLSHESGNK